MTPHEFQSLTSFVEYFTKTWVENSTKGHPFYMWNHWEHYSVRTTNHAEGWHSALRSKFKFNHPLLETFIQFIQFNNYDMYFRRVQLVNGTCQPKPRKQVYIDIDNRLQQLKVDLSNQLRNWHASGQIHVPFVLNWLSSAGHTLGSKTFIEPK